MKVFLELKPSSNPREHIRFDDGWRFHRGDLPFTRPFHSINKWEWKRIGLDKPKDLAPHAWKTRAAEKTLWTQVGTGVDVFGLMQDWTGTEPGATETDRRGGWVIFRALLPPWPDAPVMHVTGVRENAEVFLNGRFLASNERWIHPFDVPLSPAWRPKSPNSLMILAEGDPWGCWAGTAEFELPGSKPQGPTQADYDDKTWKSVSVPHDFVVEGSFDKTTDISHGYLPQTVGWYRKTFTVPKSDEGRRMRLEFDGVFRNARVWLNGCLLGRHESGYTPFAFDLTGKLKYGGKNTLAVRADARGAEGWWYEGGGIYRHVHLIKMSPIHVAPQGVFVVSSPRGKGASLSVDTTLDNQSASKAAVILTSTVLDPKGRSVLKLQTQISTLPGKTKTMKQKGRLARALPWDLEKPNLYRLVTSLKKGVSEIDRVETSFGIRSIHLDKDKGLLLNGRSVKLQGTCNHQDHAGLGVALPDRLFAYRIEKLKSMGCNAYRTAHHPHASELLDACDRLGMLVIDENRRLGDSREFLSQAEAMVRRDRNHPSVIAWSICNEEPKQGTLFGRKRGAALNKVVKHLDPTRPVTAALNDGFEKGLIDILDWIGFNYNIHQYDPVRKRRPKSPLFGSETGSTVSTRGEYVTDKEKGTLSAYDVNHPDWALPAEAAWRPIASRPYMAGAFVWTGFDYRGEPTPCSWPCINSHFGILDTCGFPKDNFWYYKAWWGKEPVLHLFPHWNWKGREGQNVDVWCHTNHDEVELFLNGRSWGTRQVPRLGHVEWKVLYEPGTLSVKAYKMGQVVDETKVETTGEPSALVLKPYVAEILADGEDVAPVEVRVVDEKGRVVPDASNPIQFRVEGPGDVAGVGNGNPSSHEPDVARERKAFHGLCAVFVRTTVKPGTIRLTAVSDGLTPATVTLTSKIPKQ